MSRHYLRHLGCFTAEYNENDRLMFPKNPPSNTTVFDTIANYNHFPIFEDENKKEYDTEMRSKYLTPKLSTNNNEHGFRKQILRKFFWRHLTRESALSTVPKFEKYDTEYNLKYSVDSYQNQTQDFELMLKYPLTGSSNATTFYTRNCICVDKRNILEPFKKTCHFSKPLEERM